MKTAAVLFLTLMLTPHLLPQGEAALPFLMLMKSAEMNATGYASVGWLSDDPAAVMDNPAHLGMQSLQTFSSASSTYVDWFPNFKLDLWYRTEAVNAGVNLQEIFPYLPHVGVGAAYGHLYMNYGTFVRTNPNSPEPLGTVDSYDEVHQLSLGMAFDHFISFAAGATYKQVTSQLADYGAAVSGRATAKLFDAGFLLDVPLARFFAPSGGRLYEVLPGLSFEGGFTAGASVCNFGQHSVSYGYDMRGDPLPRRALLGAGYYFGTQFQSGQVLLKPFSLKWTIEAQDILVNRDSLHFDYQQPPGDINIYHDILLGKAGKRVERAKGYQFTLFEIFTAYSGRFDEDENFGNRKFMTSGQALSSRGLSKIIMALFENKIADIPWLDYALRHFEFRAVTSYIDPVAFDHPLNNTKFESYSLYWRM